MALQVRPCANRGTYAPYLPYLFVQSNSLLLKKEIRFFHHDLLLKETMLEPTVMVFSTRFTFPGLLSHLLYLPAAFILFY